MTKKKTKENHCHSAVIIPPCNPVSETVWRYARFYHLTTDDIGKALGCSGSNVRYMLKRPLDCWRMDEIKRYCEVVNCPMSFMMEEIAKQVA